MVGGEKIFGGRLLGLFEEASLVGGHSLTIYDTD
tara:strand:- start:402 stop:503 length:102 start_codon:yes stop_codon:yes gene_type:complete